MQDATENKDISATQAALAESMAQLQMMRLRHQLVWLTFTTSLQTLLLLLHEPHQ
jgi:hypothetical protein